VVEGDRNLPFVGYLIVTDVMYNGTFGESSVDDHREYCSNLGDIRSVICTSVFFRHSLGTTLTYFPSDGISDLSQRSRKTVTTASVAAMIFFVHSHYDNYMHRSVKEYLY
jgi:hypothetical protein